MEEEQEEGREKRRGRRRRRRRKVPRRLLLFTVKMEKAHHKHPETSPPSSQNMLIGPVTLQFQTAVLIRGDECGSLIMSARVFTTCSVRVGHGLALTAEAEFCSCSMTHNHPVIILRLSK